MKRLLLSAILALLIFPFICKGADLKFFKKTAEQIWKMNPELFDATREIPDSIAEGHSAVILMKYHSLTADYNSVSNAQNDKTFTKRKIFMRCLVKLLDQNGVKEFAQHEFGESMRAKVAYYTFMKSDNAFGARIHKPDGTVTDVDISKAFAMTEGKKGKDKDAIKRKIDIPGLEPGDVLEYFVYDEDEVQEFDAAPVRIPLISKYPILESMIECRFAPELTVEYRGYNEAPDFERKEDNKYNHIVLHRYNLPVLTDRRMIIESRQVPFYMFYTLNNTSKRRYYPYSARSGGLNSNILPGTVYRDISHTLAAADYGNHPLPSNLKSAVKNYIKSNPEATREDIFKAAWTAAAYLNKFDDENRASDYWLAVMFSDVARKEAWADSIGVAFLNSRDDVPTDRIINWRQPDFGVLADGRFYLENSVRYMPAGDLPAFYQGETGGAYMQKRENLRNFKVPKVFKAHTSTSNKNRISVQCELSLDEDNGIAASYDVSHTGTTKEITRQFTDLKEWAEEVENYLGIPEKKRYRAKTYDTHERQKEIRELAKDYVTANLYDNDEVEIDSVAVLERGIVPTSPMFRIALETKMPNTVSNAGNSLAVSIGRFIGSLTEFTPDDRKRQTDIFFSSPIQIHFDIKLRVPEGYEVDPASLENIKTNVSNPLGMFYAEAKINDDGTVSLNTRSKANIYTAPIAAWEGVLELYDAEAALHDAVIVFKKK